MEVWKALDLMGDVDDGLIEEIDGLAGEYDAWTTVLDDIREDEKDA